MAASTVDKAKAAMETKVFRVDAFRNPVLPEDQRRALEAEEAQPLDMSVAGVLAAARDRTGLSDFGPRDFEARLARLLGEVEADPNVWRRYKAQFLEQCVAAAANRLRNQAFLTRHPEINDIP